MEGGEGVTEAFLLGGEGGGVEGEGDEGIEAGGVVGAAVGGAGVGAPGLQVDGGEREVDGDETGKAFDVGVKTAGAGGAARAVVERHGAFEAGLGFAEGAGEGWREKKTFALRAAAGEVARWTGDLGGRARLCRADGGRWGGRGTQPFGLG